MAGKNIIHKKYPEQQYSVVFNKKTGFFARIENKGSDEPFWAMQGPELIDISITNYCKKNCHFCYRNSSEQGKHIQVEDYTRIINQAKEIGVFQVAIGGGNPNQHPEFIKILKTTYDNGIIPSYTSNGTGLSDDILKATELYCGAMAISAYKPFSELASIINKIQNYKIKLNIHFVLDKNTITTAIDWLNNPPKFLDKVNAVIFLNYKPINSPDTLLLNKSDKLPTFFNLVKNKKNKFKIGFDSCSVSGIVEQMDINPMYYESCEAGRFSAFISEDMKMYPCSFMADTNRYGDLKKNSIKEIWQNNTAFKNFRNKISDNDCKLCKYQDLCKGGCLFLPEINLCDMEELNKEKSTICQQSV